MILRISTVVHYYSDIPFHYAPIARSLELLWKLFFLVVLFEPFWSSVLHLQGILHWLLGARFHGIALNLIFEIARLHHRKADICISPHNSITFSLSQHAGLVMLLISPEQKHKQLFWRKKTFNIIKESHEASKPRVSRLYTDTSSTDLVHWFIHS